MAEASQKVALISHSLGEGGAERFAAKLSLMLDSGGYEVHVIIIEDRIDYAFGGRLLNLGALCTKMNPLQRKIQKGVLLNRYLNSNAIDTIIDNRARNVFVRDFIATRIYGNRKIFNMVHSYNIQSYLPKSEFLANLLYQKSTLICVAKTIEAEIKKYYPKLNSTTIYNAADFADVSTEVSTSNYILFFGRFDDKVKNLSLLLKAYRKSEIYRNGLKLHLMGDGPDKALLVSLIADLNLDKHVLILPFQNDPRPYVKNARFTVLTSRFEGFPMSIIESLALGTPVVSVDCKSGPAELIINRENGLLIENHNIDALASALSEFAENNELYHICKSNAKNSITHLAIEKISAQWNQLLNN